MFELFVELLYKGQRETYDRVTVWEESIAYASISGQSGFDWSGATSGGIPAIFTDVKDQKTGKVWKAADRCKFFAFAAGGSELARMTNGSSRPARDLTVKFHCVEKKKGASVG